MLRSEIAFAAVLVACTAAPRPTDAALPDAHTAPDTGTCVAESITASCPYSGYGSTCTIPCDVPADCTFSVSVTWAGNYCCPVGGEGAWVDCICEHGSARCRPAFAPLPLGLPTSTCEFCDIDAAFLDGGTDAGVDATTGDASTDAALDDTGTEVRDASTDT